MIQDFFINEITLKKQGTTTYEDGISKKNYGEESTVKCRISSLSYKDLQLLSDTDNVQRNVMKMYVNASVDIDPKDEIVWNGEQWTVIAHYTPQDKTKIHHNKYFIKKVK